MVRVASLRIGALMATRGRSVRVPDELWNSAITAARAEGRTVTEVVINALTALVNRKA